MRGAGSVPGRRARHDGAVRFQVSQTLDAIEARLSTDPLVAGAVVDLAEVVRLADLDAGRPASLLRLGLAVDALTRQLGDETAALYPVADRALLADTDLGSNERMVIRRWSDDGLVELLPAECPVPARLREVAELTRLALVTRAPVPGFAGTGYALLPAAGGAVLSPHPPAAAPPPAQARPAGRLGARRNAAEPGGPATRAHPALGRWWRCPVADCASFGPPRGAAQPPPALVAAVPTCPRHGEKLADAGARPVAVPVAVCLEGAVRHRFPVVAGRPVVVGRRPDDPSGVALAEYLDEQSARWISRNHIRLELHGWTLAVTDTSTNGTLVLVRTGPAERSRPVPLTAGQSRSLGEWDTVRLHEGVELRRADRPGTGRAGTAAASVMSEAPTVSMRLPRD